MVVEFSGPVFTAERESPPLRPVAKLEQRIFEIARGEVVIRIQVREVGRSAAHDCTQHYFHRMRGMKDNDRELGEFNSPHINPQGRTTDKNSESNQNKREEKEGTRKEKGVPKDMSALRTPRLWRSQPWEEQCGLFKLALLV